MLPLSLKARWRRWVVRRIPAAAQVQLNQRRIFIMPNRVGAAFALVLLLMPVLAPGLPGAPDDVGQAARLIGIEVLVGLWLGGLARLVAMAMAMAPL